MSYEALSAIYDYLLSADEREKLARFAADTVSRLRPGTAGADLGCGTGAVTRALKERNLTVTGVDVSVGMLNAALAQSEGIEYVLMDIKRLSGFSDLGFVTAVNDVVNYIAPKSLDGFFRRVNACLSDGGVFLFDVSSEYKLRKIIGGNTFTETDEKVSYIWENVLYKDRVKMYLTYFILKNGTYERKEEEHIQYVHREKDLTDALRRAGFEVLSVGGGSGGRKTERSQRLNFIAVKRVGLGAVK